MKWSLNSLDAAFAHDFDAVIDVRSPAEYAEDHVPGAISLPVLDDEERARVGTLYKQVSPFQARKLGAALVFRNAANHIETALSHHPGGWQPLVYCWRGGQRSGSFAWILREIGWRSAVVDGGYKSFRRLITQTLYTAPLPHRFVLLGGYTGTAKTALLPRLASRGVQVLDLEGLARHRGSLLGQMPGGQPSQKAFETALAKALHALDPSRPVVVEAESSKIGAINLPPSLWDVMKSAPWIDVVAPLDARARYLAEAYVDILSDGPRLSALLQPLRHFRGHALVAHWQDLIAKNDRLALCQSLAADHYDPAYTTSRRGHVRTVLGQCETEALCDVSLDRLADQVVGVVQSSTI